MILHLTLTSKKVKLLSRVQLFVTPWIVAYQALPGASVRNSAHGKGREEGGLAYTKA